MSNRLDQEREQRLQPQRMNFVRHKLNELGYEIIYENANELRFMHNNSVCKVWPYSGWFSGKGLISKRGVRNLFEQLKQST